MAEATIAEPRGGWTVEAVKRELEETAGDRDLAEASVVRVRERLDTLIAIGARLGMTQWQIATHARVSQGVVSQRLAALNRGGS